MRIVFRTLWTMGKNTVSIASIMMYNEWTPQPCTRWKSTRNYEVLKKIMREKLVRHYELWEHNEVWWVMILTHCTKEKKKQCKYVFIWDNKESNENNLLTMNKERMYFSRQNTMRYDEINPTLKQMERCMIHHTKRLMVKL